MYCGKCGADNVDGDSFCVKCGSPLAGTKAAAPPSPAPTAAFAGISCFWSDGCGEPVIGQCPGYKGNCLRFYCSFHSTTPYCAVCAKAMERDAAIEAIFNQYLEAAKRIPAPIGPGCGCTILIVISLITLWLLQMAFGDDADWMMLPSLASGIIGLAVIGQILSRPTERAIAAAAERLPGFREFYAAYLTHKEAENARSLLTSLLVAGAAAKAIDDYQVRQDIHKIARKM